MVAGYDFPVVPSLRGDRAPPNDCLCLPPISVYSEYVLKQHVTTIQQAIMEKGMLKFKHTVILVGSFLHSLQNCWPPTAVHKCDE